MNDPITKSVSNAYKKMKAEELTDKQKKHIDKNNNNKIDSHDFKLLRKEEDESIDEVKMADLQSTKVQGRSYGASKPEPHAVDTLRGPKEKELKDIEAEKKKKQKKKPFSEMLETYKSAGLKSLFEAIEEKSFAEESMQEEVEELDELSKDTLNSYVKKSFSDKEKDNLNTPERQKGLRKATSRLYKEDEEHIEELSTPTLASYVKKVGHEGAWTKKRTAGVNSALNKVKQNSMKSEEMDINDINGVQMSNIEEDNMNSAEMEKREKIVKGMKKGMAGFKERYGARAGNVMYATATKQAMK